MERASDGSDGPVVAPRGQNVPRAKYDRLFIVTYGRSGSTLLQGVLNALPGYLIRGENNDLLGEMQEFYDKLPRFSDQRATESGKPGGTTTPEHAFYGFERFCDANLATASRRFCDFMLAGDTNGSCLRCLGFKEIRYTPENVSAKVDFLRTLYPGCAVVYNIRNPEDVVASEFQKNKSVDYIRKFNSTLLDLASVDPNSFLVKYEDVVAGSGTLRGLYGFLGEPFSRDTFEAVLQKKHSYHIRGKGSAYSNVPASVKVIRKLRDVELFIVDTLVSKGETTQIDGFLLQAGGASSKQFTKLSTDDGGEIAFTARYGLPSPKLRRQLGTELPRPRPGSNFRSSPTPRRVQLRLWHPFFQQRRVGRPWSACLSRGRTSFCSAGLIGILADARVGFLGLGCARGDGGPEVEPPSDRRCLSPREMPPRHPVGCRDVLPRHRNRACHRRLRRPPHHCRWRVGPSARPA